MSHDAEHLITELGGVDRSAVETCILDCDSRSLCQRFSQTKIARPIGARRGRGDETPVPRGVRPRIRSGNAMSDRGLDARGALAGAPALAQRIRGAQS